MKHHIYPRYTLHGSPADFYVFRDNGPGVPCFWSRWVKGRSDLEWRIKPQPRTGWINVYLATGYEDYTTTSSYDTREEADKHSAGRIACVQWTEQEGL